ncbi:hypothetical protein Cus16_3190 [Curtobacterium sp. ER1/6]|nr:hypothetical protein Cus16_3190 [Curtobacterium sp. ER1/6]
MRVGGAQGSGDGRADQVLRDVELGDLLRRGSQTLLDDLARDDDLGDRVPTAPTDAVHRGGLLVRAEVARDADVPQPRLPREDRRQQLVRRLRHHVVPGRVARGEREAQEEQVADDLGVHLDELREAALPGDELLELVLPRQDAAGGDVRGGGAVGLHQDGAGHALVDDGRDDAALDHP